MKTTWSIDLTDGFLSNDAALNKSSKRDMSPLSIMYNQVYGVDKNIRPSPKASDEAIGKKRHVNVGGTL